MAITINSLPEVLAIQRQKDQAVSGAHPIVAVLTAIFLFSLYLLPTTVGLDADAAVYAKAGLSLICGDWRTVWGNYGHEPVFFSVLWFLSEIWNFLFSSGCHQITGTSKFWLPIFVAVIFILLLIYVTRHLGRSAIYFHMVVCLDTALMMLPFNLLRQFMALAIVVLLLSLLIRERITPIAFSVYLVVPSLIHWSIWLLVLVAVPAVMAPRFPVLINKFLKARELIRMAPWLAIAIALLGGASIYYYDFLPTKLFSRLGSSSAFFSLFSPVTPFVVALACAVSRYTRHDFARRFVIYLIIAYLLIPLFGADALVMDRARLLALVVSYFMFLYIRNTADLSPRWEVFNLAFLSLEFSSFFWHEVVDRPFEERLTFAALGL